MTAGFNPYHHWLGIDPQIAAPTYYDILGIEPGEQDLRAIATAADRTASRVRSHRPGEHAAQWAALLDEIAVAKKCLTHDTDRRAYDASLVERATAPGPSRSLASAPLGRPESSSSRSATLPELAAAMAPLPIPPDIDPTISAAVPPAIDAKTLPESLTPELKQEDALPVAAAPMFLRKRKRRRIGIPLAATIGSLMFIALAVYGYQRFFQYRGTQSQVELANSSSRSTSDPPHPEPEALSKPPVEADASLQSNATNANGSSEAEGPPKPNLESLATQPGERQSSDGSASLGEAASPGLAATNMPAPVSTPPANDAPAMTVSTSSPATDPAKSDMPAKEPTVPDEPKRSSEDLRKLGLALRKARESIGTHEFDLANEFLAIAKTLVEAPDELAKLDRLKILLEAVEQYREAILTSVAKLEPGTSFEVGETTVGVVEANREKLVVRAGAQNRSFEIHELPLRLGNVLAEQSLADQDPVNRTLKAAYTIAHPKATAADITAARAVLEQTAESVDDAKSLLTLLDDSYEFAPQ